MRKTHESNWRDKPPKTSSAKSAPASSDWLSGRVTTLLRHYYEPSQVDEEIRAVLRDWLHILDGFSAQAVEMACRGYLRDQPRRRPTPGDIAGRARTVEKEEDGGETYDPGKSIRWGVEKLGLWERDAAEAIAAPPTEYPEWLPDKPYHRDVYALRQKAKECRR